MSYFRPSGMDSPTPEETISIDTMNFPETFFITNNTADAEPISLVPLRRSNSADSCISEHVNRYFRNFQPSILGKPGSDAIQRTKTFLDRDWRKRTERHGSWLEKTELIAIQVFNDTRSKLTKLITDVAVLFPYLKQMEILTSDDCEKIDHNRLRSLKTDALIDIIITRGIKGVVYFCESLKIHYNHLYLTMKQIFEINGIEIDSLLDSGGRKAKVISEIFRSIEDIMGPKFAQEKLDAQQLLDSISAVKMDNVSSQDINELRGRYIELQNHYQPIQHIIDTLTTDITTKYNCLTSENEAALAAIDKLHTENREIYEKMRSLHLRLELQQDELERRSTNHEGEENTALYQRIMDLGIPGEKLELMRLNQKLQKEKIQNAQLKDQIEAIRKEKDELFDINQGILKENVELKSKAVPVKSYDYSNLKSNELTQLEALSNTVKKKNKDINQAISMITPKKSEYFQVITKPPISIENQVKQHLAQSIEIGAFFSDNLDPSLVKSFQPGDRILRINNIKLSNMTNTNFPQIMMQQVESSLKLLISPGPISMGKMPYEEHSFTFTQDEISRCSSPCTFVDIGRLTPIPDYHRRISNQSQEALMRPDSFLPTLKQPPMYDNSMLTRARAETRVCPSREFTSFAKSAFESNYTNTTVSSCPSTPQLERPYSIAINPGRPGILKSMTNESGSDTISQDSDPLSNSKPLEKAKLTTALDPPDRTHRFELDASPMFPKQFRGPLGSLEAMPDNIFTGRTDTGITGMIIIPRSQTNMRPETSVEDSSTAFNQDQIYTTLSNESFLKHAKISGGFGNPFFLSCSKELNQFRLKSGQKIYQIDDISTEYLTYEKFIFQCNQSPALTLFVSLNPSPDFKPDGLNVRDYFYVIAHFTTNSIRMKGELFVSPSCVYLVTDTMFSKDNTTAAQNRYWHVTRIDPRNCNNIEKGVIPSDLWLNYSINHSEESFEFSIESRGPQASIKSSVTDLEVFEHDIGYYYDLEGVKNKEENDFTKSPFSCYTLVTRQDHLPQPVILFDYHWEEYSEKLTSQNGTNNPSRNTKFQLISPTIIENVDHDKNAELEAEHRTCEIIYYKGTDGKARFVDTKSLIACAENHYTPVLLCPIGQIYDAPVLVQLNPIVIRLKFKYKYKFDAPVDQRFHFDDMLSVGLSEEKYLKKLINLIDSNRVLYEWKAVVIES